MSILRFHEALKRTRMGAQQFFKIAHMWKFGTQRDCQADFTDYISNSKIPAYAMEYANHILAGEHDDTFVGKQ